MGEAMALRSPVGARSWCLPTRLSGPSERRVVSRRRALSTGPERSVLPRSQAHRRESERSPTYFMQRGPISRHVYFSNVNTDTDEPFIYKE